LLSQVTELLKESVTVTFTRVISTFILMTADLLRSSGSGFLGGSGPATCAGRGAPKIKSATRASHIHCLLPIAIPIPFAGLFRRLRFRQDHRCARGSRGVVAHDALRLVRLIGTQIVRPAESDGLVPEFGLNVEGAR